MIDRATLSGHFENISIKERLKKLMGRGEVLINNKSPLIG